MILIKILTRISMYFLQRKDTKTFLLFNNNRHFFSQKKIQLQTERFLMLPVELQHHHLQKYHLR